jgi:hypothetical protein
MRAVVALMGAELKSYWSERKMLIPKLRLDEAFCMLLAMINGKTTMDM